MVNNTTEEFGASFKRHSQPDENDIQFVNIESEQDQFISAMDEDEDVLAVTPDFTQISLKNHGRRVPANTV